MIQDLLNDSDFEWKYLKYKEYSQKYTEYEIQLKEKFSILKFLT